MNREEFLAKCSIKWEDYGYGKTKEMNLAQLEGMIWEMGMDLARSLLVSRLEDDPRGKEPAICPTCKKGMRIQEAQQRRALKTVVGEVQYKRAYGVCDRCGHSGAALDEALGIPRRGPSAAAREKICHVAVVGRSFDDASELLRVHGGIRSSGKHVRTLAEAEGRRLVEQRVAKVQAFRDGKIDSTSKEAPKLLVVVADGGRVQTRQETKDERWKEDKIGVVYDAVACPEDSGIDTKYQGAKAHTKSYVATMESWEEMGWMLRVEAEHRGYCRAKEKLFLGDGARSVREVKDLHFPDATFILDWFHAVEHLSNSSKAAFGEGSSRARDWYEQHKQKLWDGEVDTIIDELQRLSAGLGKSTEDDTVTSPRRILHRDANSYFPNNKDAMNYPAFRAKGWPIGSGVVESAVKQFAIRLKGSEKFWNVSQTGAEEMLALCALYHCEDGRWDRYWRLRAQPTGKQSA